MGEDGRVTHVPALLTAGPLEPARVWRADRRERQARPLRIALITDGGSRIAAGALAGAGLAVTGLLGPDALESLAWAAEEQLPGAYADLAALLADEVDAVALDVPPPRSDALLRAAARAGLEVLLTLPRTADAGALVEVLATLDDGDLGHAVAVTGRADPAYDRVTALLPRLGPVSQVTVAPWPAGGPPRTELVDLVRRWCGDVVAVCADPDAMPAESLGDESPVTLALLTERGATVLASERFGARQAACAITLIGADGRIVLHESTLLAALGQRPLHGEQVGRADPAAALRLAAGGLADGDTRAATLRDLLVAARVLAAVETSRTDGGWVELG